MTDKTVYLISGANTGIGLGYVTWLTRDPTNIVYAGCRTPSQATDLIALQKERPNVHIVQLFVGQDENARSVVEQIRTGEGRLDTVIANAGTGDAFAKVGDSKPELFRSCFEINTLGPVMLFQAAQSLLLQSPKAKFFVTSSFTASMNVSHVLECSAYASSKAAINYIITRMHVEYPNMVSIALSPGWLQTRMGDNGATYVGKTKAPFTVDEAMPGLIKVITTSTRAESGKFFHNDGRELAW